MVTKNAVFMRAVAFRKRLYLYEKAGKYYLHSGNENFQLDSEAVDLMEKSGFEFQKGEK